VRRGRQSRISGADHWPEDTTREASVAAAEGKATSFRRRSVYRRRQTGSKGNWLRTGKSWSRAIPHRVRGLREPSFRRSPLERIG